MGEELDSQRAKRAAAAAYDYDGDSRWAEYWSNVLIPPHMASGPDVVDHYKRKFYQRFIDPDFVVETMSSSSTSQLGRASEESPTRPISDHARPHNSGPSTARSSPPQRVTNSTLLDQRTIHFSLNAWVLIMAMIGVFPSMSRILAKKAYRLSLLGTACSSFYSLYTLYGKPRAWNLHAIRSWFQMVLTSKDFIRLLYCLIFLKSQLRFKVALIPLICRALELTAKFLRRNFTYSPLYRTFLAQPCLWVEANSTVLNIMSANAEVMVGYLLVMSLFSWQRNIVLAFMYWQLLKLMYHAPATARYHRSLWVKMGQIVNPYIYRYVPFLNIPISAVQRWWFR